MDAEIISLAEAKKERRRANAAKVVASNIIDALAAGEGAAWLTGADAQHALAQLVAEQLANHPDFSGEITITEAS